MFIPSGLKPGNFAAQDPAEVAPSKKNVFYEDS
jgi:hypothetical protein